jgi:hypothetical protein
MQCETGTVNEKPGTCSPQAPPWHDAARQSCCLQDTQARDRTYALAAERDSSIATPAGGCAAHAVACPVPELTLITSAMPYHSR